MATEEEIAWAAGLFEGEGCFSYSQRRARASMSLTDLDVLERFQRVVGCGAIGIANKGWRPHHKQAWQWWGNGDDFVKVLALLEPWLCERRRATGQRVLARRMELHAKFQAGRQCERCGITFVPKTRGETTKAKNANRSFYLKSKPPTPRRAFWRSFRNPRQRRAGW